MTHNDIPLRSHGAGRHIDDIRRRIRARGDRPDVTAAELLRLVDDLAAFPFGAYLLENGGINGFWTDYMIYHPERGRTTGRAPDGHDIGALESRVLDALPTFLATQERARIFNALIQERVRDGAVLASIPCGLMRDLLGRDYAGLEVPPRLVGIDLDQESLDAARALAGSYGLAEVCDLRRHNAFDLPEQAEFDLIASNGLNIYEHDDDQVERLYRAFFQALKPGGLLITSFLTPPPTLDPDSEWLPEGLEPAALRLQKLIFVDVLEAGWQAFRSSQTTASQLHAAGFRQLRFHYDAHRIFPTVTAERPA